MAHEPSLSSTAAHWENTGRAYLSMWMKRELILCLVGRLGEQRRRASRGIVSLLRLTSRMRNTMGHFSSNPSPPSTGRRPVSSQRHHCLTDPVCLLFHGRWRFIYFIQDDSYDHPIHSLRHNSAERSFVKCYPTHHLNVSDHPNSLIYKKMTMCILKTFSSCWLRTVKRDKSSKGKKIFIVNILLSLCWTDRLPKQNLTSAADDTSQF